MKRHPVTSVTVAHVRIDNERARPPPSPIQTYKQLWISTTTTTAATCRIDRLRGPGVPLVLPPAEQEEEEALKEKAEVGGG